MKVFAQNFRGFKYASIDLSKVNFLVGDNSCGKSSLLYLVDAVTRNDLNSEPTMIEDLAVDQYDYFSPYFSYADVTFGFTNHHIGKFAKIITVGRGDHHVPFIKRVSFFSDEGLVSLKKEGKKCFRRNGLVRDFEERSLLKLHSSDSGYVEAEMDPGTSIAEPVSIMITSKGAGVEQDRKMLSSAMDNITFGCRITSPLRALPEKFYNAKRRLNAHGRHFASLWMDFSEAKESVLHIEDLQNFGKESGLFEQINVSKVSDKLEDSPLVVTVKRGGADFTLNQVGIGISQVVPVLIETMFSLASEHPHVLMQQPELHLHPVAQAALGSYLAKSCSRGLRPVVETHSSYLMDRFRAEIAATAGKKLLKKTRNFDTEIIFCENTERGNTATHIGISKKGEILNAPESYHKFFVEEMLRTMI